MIIIVGVWYGQIYSPNIKAIKEKRDRLETLNIKLNKSKLTAGQLAAIQREVEDAFIKYKLLEKLVPLERDVPDFLNKINMAARENNVKISKIDLEASELHNFYTADPYRVEVMGNYHDIGGFLEGIANLPFIATIKNVQVKSSANKKMSVISSMTVTSYHMGANERLQAPTQLAGGSRSQGGGKPEGGGKPRATEDDAVTGLSGGAAGVIE